MNAGIPDGFVPVTKQRFCEVMGDFGYTRSGFVDIILCQLPCSFRTVAAQSHDGTQFWLHPNLVGEP